MVYDSLGRIGESLDGSCRCLPSTGYWTLDYKDKLPKK